MFRVGRDGCLISKWPIGSEMPLFEKTTMYPKTILQTKNSKEFKKMTNLSSYMNDELNSFGFFVCLFYFILDVCKNLQARGIFF